MATTPSRDVRPVFSRIPTESIRSINGEHLALMCASALFAGLTPRECTEILGCARARSYARNEILFRQGNPAESLVLIQSGSVKLTQLSAQGDEVILRMTGSGDALGAHESPMGCNHTCSARAMEQCTALVWNYARLQSLMAQYPQIGANIGRILNGKLQELEVRFREIATERVAKRLALTLIRLLNPLGKKTPAGEVELNVSR